MKKSEWNAGVNHLDPDLVEKYVLQKDRLEQKNKTLWLRFGAIAACFILIFCAPILLSMLSEDTSGIESYFPNGEPWSPVIDPSVESVVLYADKVADIFSVPLSDGTNQYTKIYSSSPEYLGIDPLPNAEYLPIYSANKKTLSKSEFQNFIVRYLDCATELLGIHQKNYEIEQDERPNGEPFFRAIIKDQKLVGFYTKNNSLYLRCWDTNDDRLAINGKKVSVLESDSDEQIKKKLEDTVAYVSALFGKRYTDIKICREYASHQLKTINVYLYSAEATIFPPNFSKAPMSSDYILLELHTDWGSGTMYSWGGSKQEAFLTEISLYQASESWNDYYSVDAKAKMLALQEAEALLEKGYVFGGHACPLCMAAQPEVDFSEYTYVNVEYVSDENGELYIPFYAFYKCIGTNANGINTYAKTYVLAVQASGYEQYFEEQKSSHR